MHGIADAAPPNGRSVRRLLRRLALVSLGRPDVVPVLTDAVDVGGLAEATTLVCPKVLSIAELDLVPGLPRSSQVADATIEPPSVSRDLCLVLPEVKRVDSPLTLEGCDLRLSTEDWEAPTVSGNLAELFFTVGVDGTLFFLRREPELGAERLPGRAPVVPPSQRQPVPPNIFELLLPVLMPPAKTEFGTDLLLPKALYGFQRYGVKWLAEHPSALLADDMGLGKTVEAIVAFRVLVRLGRALHALVVCPKSVVPSWRRHFEEWAPELQVATLGGTEEARRLQWASYPKKCHVLISNYELLVRDDEEVGRSAFDLVVADEVQRIKNPETKTARTMRALRSKQTGADGLAQFRWGLTGTPLENRVEDVVAIFQFLKPGLFRVSDEPFPSMVRGRIEPYMLRRRKHDVLKELPEKVRDVRFVELSEAQRSAYDEAERTGVVHLQHGENITVQHVLALITKLKQICNFDPRTGESAKLDWLEEQIETAVEEGGKVLVFSQFVESLKQVRPHLDTYLPLVYTGDLSGLKRERTEQVFQTDDTHKVMLLSLRAGGLGLNLTAANYVVHFDSWWNPATRTQAEDRVHRIGQRKTVFVTTLIAENTIEERIERLLEQKKHLFNIVIDDLSDPGLQKVLSEEELFGFFGLKPRRIVAAARAPSAVPAATPQGVVFRREEPFSNVVRLREILRSCEEYIWWADPHFRTRALEELAAVVDPSRVRCIRILSRAEMFDDRAKSDFSRFKQEMSVKGIESEWRVTARSASHDRYIVGKGVAYNVPPVGAMFEGAYSEGLPSNRPPFEGWWEKARPPGEPG